MLRIRKLQYSDVGMGNVLSVKDEVYWALGFLLIFQIVAGWVFEIRVDFSLVKFFPPSLFVSLLSLLHVRFVVLSCPQADLTMGTALPFFFFDDDWVTVIGATSLSIADVVILWSCFC